MGGGKKIKKMGKSGSVAAIKFAHDYGRSLSCALDRMATVKARELICVSLHVCVSERIFVTKR